MVQLSQRYHQLDQDKNKNDHACSQKLCEGMKVVSKLVIELDEVRALNFQVENEQVHLMEQVTQLQQECDGLSKIADYVKQEVRQSSH